MFAQIVSVVGVMFILVFVGMFIRHIKIINKNFTTNLSGLLILVTYPALIFYSMITEFSRRMIVDALILVISGVLICFLGYIIGLFFSLFLKLKDTERNTFLILCTFGNTSFLSIPIGFALYGMNAVVKIILFDLGCYVVLWTLGIWLVSSHQNAELKNNFVKNILNPGIVALIIGLAVVMSGLKLPEVFSEGCKLLGSVTIPMSLIATGSLLYGAGFHRRVRGRTLVALAAGKLVAMPLLAILILSITNLSAPVRTIIVLEAAMPSMVLSTILADKYNSDSKLAASGVFLTTLVSILTVPIFLSFV